MGMITTTAVTKVMVITDTTMGMKVMVIIAGQDSWHDYHLSYQGDGDHWNDNGHERDGDHCRIGQWA